jgi:hypothetical protein
MSTVAVDTDACLQCLSTIQGVCGCEMHVGIQPVSQDVQPADLEKLGWGHMQQMTMHTETWLNLWRLSHH